MLYVYILNSQIDLDRFYIGKTNDLRRRFKEHNSGLSKSTSYLAPWSLVTYLAFTDESKATAFEKYLKTRSGRDFAKRHL